VQAVKVIMPKASWFLSGSLRRAARERTYLTWSVSWGIWIHFYHYITSRQDGGCKGFWLYQISIIQVLDARETLFVLGFPQKRLRYLSLAFVSILPFSYSFLNVHLTSL
jgi:hypothetical protein